MLTKEDVLRALQDEPDDAQVFAMFGNVLCPVVGIMVSEDKEIAFITENPIGTMELVGTSDGVTH